MKRDAPSNVGTGAGENDDEVNSLCSASSSSSGTSGYSILYDGDSFSSTDSSTSTKAGPASKRVAATPSSFINPDTMAAAAAIMARDQSNNRRRPVLLGSNKDGTINVQLPTGMVIAVEATAFPDYNKTATTAASATAPSEPAMRSATTSLNAPAVASTAHIVETTRNTPSSTRGPLTKAPPVRITSTANAIATKPQPPHALEQSTAKATRLEIERALPLAASCVFHIFDRRVNLDAHSGTVEDTYSLLRAWAQDDPYRYRPVASLDHPPLPPSSARYSALQAFDAAPQKRAPKTKTSDSNPLPTGGSCQPLDQISALRAANTHTSPANLQALRDGLVQRARAIKKQKTARRNLKAQDAKILQRLRERDLWIE
jgi:LIN37